MIKSSPEGSYDTDGDRWKCKPSTLLDFYLWVFMRYNDDHWPKAELIGLNGDCRYNQKFFAACVNMSEYASWIWHPSINTDGFYCRMSQSKIVKLISC